MLLNSVVDGDIIVASPSEVWVIEQELRKQAREDEEQDELLRQVQLPCDTCCVWEQGDFDGTGVDESWGREPDVILDHLLRGGA